MLVPSGGSTEKSIICAGTFVVDIITGMLDVLAGPDSGQHVSVTSNPGGNALNVAVNLVNLGVEGVDIYCCGAVGNDPEAGFLRSALADNGITARLVESSLPTAKAIILNYTGNRRGFIVDKGASVDFGSKSLMEAISDIGPGVFYIGESAASPGMDADLPELVKHAKNLGCITVLDYIVHGESHSGRLFECARNTDLLHVNEFEAKVLTGEKHIVRAAERMHEKGFKTVCVSEGEKGFVLGFGDKIIHFPVFSVHCVDATGAGDAFCAGMIFFIRKNGKPPENLEEAKEMALFASACGACAVTETGCTTGLTPDKAEELIRRSRR